MVTKSTTPTELEPTVLYFDLQATPGHLLRRCHQRSREVFNKHMRGTGLSRQLLSVLISIYQNSGATYTVLSEASGFDRNTLAEMINRLVDRKLARRKQADDDARAYSVELTAKGRKLLESVIGNVQQVQEEILTPLPPELRPVFVRCLRIMIGLEPEKSK